MEINDIKLVHSYLINASRKNNDKELNFKVALAWERITEKLFEEEQKQNNQICLN